MKISKKILSGVLSLVMVGTVSSPLVEASASTYLRGDANGNGTVNLADLSTIQTFLSGHEYANGATAERMDINKDYVINSYDRTLLSNMLFNNASSVVLSYVNSSSLPSQYNRTYYVYSPTTGNMLTNRDYTLATLSTIGSSSVSTMSIIDDDDRIMENGLDGVINVQNADGTNRGTAFVVDSHTLLTAAHVIYGQCNLQFKIFSDYNTESDISITPKEYHIPAIYTTSSYAWRYDYAIVTVQEDLSDYINFDLGIMRDGMSLTKPVYATGFGGNCAEIATGLANVKSTGVGTLLSTPNNIKNYSFYFSTDIVPGDSGCPVYVINTDGSKSVIGICSHEGGSFNQAVRINNNILHFVYNNSNLE